MNRPSTFPFPFFLVGGASVAILIFLYGHWSSSHVAGVNGMDSRNAAAKGASPSSARAHLSPAAAIRRMLGGDYTRLTPEEIAAYVEAKKNSVESLIAAWQLSRDPAWLLEAAEQYPDDPGVATAMLAAEGTQSSQSAQWIDVLKRHDPHHPLGALYAAKAALGKGDISAAITELAILDSQSRLELPTRDWTGAMIEAYRNAGHAGLEAEWAGIAQTPAPWSELNALNSGLAQAMTAAAAMGDREKAAALGEGAMKAASLVARGAGEDTLVARLVSLSMERQVLHQMEGFDLVPGDPKLVVERLHEMDREIAGIQELISQSRQLLPTLTDTEAQQYTRRVRVDGEVQALQWLVARKGGR